MTKLPYDFQYKIDDSIRLYDETPEIREQIIKHLESLNFTYHVGLAEEVTPLLNKKYDLMTDVFGAFFYSDKRYEILRQMHSNLNLNGKAFIMLKDSSVGVNDQILLKNGETRNLFEYLAETYPETFQYHKDSFSMTKTSDQFPFPKVKELERSYNERRNTFYRPEFLFKEI